MTDTPTERESESMWIGLRRRKVVQWGLVYVAGAWGFLQGLEYGSEAFGLPTQVRNEPKFKAVFADIERDTARQRARLAARPKDAPLELTETSR